MLNICELSNLRCQLDILRDVIEPMYSGPLANSLLPLGEAELCGCLFAQLIFEPRERHWPDDRLNQHLASTCL